MINMQSKQAAVLLIMAHVVVKVLCCLIGLFPLEYNGKPFTKNDKDLNMDVRPKDQST